VVATGVTPRQLQFEGIDHPKVLRYIQYYVSVFLSVSVLRLLVLVVLVLIQLNILSMKVKVVV
jgi:hypothetical protein